MPLYMVNTKVGEIGDAARVRIADGITRIHCDVTGSLPMFVNVFFFEEAKHLPRIDQRVSIFGGIRAGRSDDQKAVITAMIRGSVGEHALVTPDDVHVALRDTPASWVMEGGEIMPEPGEEAAWLARHGLAAD